MNKKYVDDLKLYVKEKGLASLDQEYAPLLSGWLMDAGCPDLERHAFLDAFQLGIPQQLCLVAKRGQLELTQFVTQSIRHLVSNRGLREDVARFSVTGWGQALDLNVPIVTFSNKYLIEPKASFEPLTELIKSKRVDFGDRHQTKVLNAWLADAASPEFERHLIVVAFDCEIPEQLSRARSNAHEHSQVFARCVRQLVVNRGLRKDAAEYSVRAWAKALGLRIPQVNPQQAKPHAGGQTSPKPVKTTSSGRMTSPRHQKRNVKNVQRASPRIQTTTARRTSKAQPAPTKSKPKRIPLLVLLLLVALVSIVVLRRGRMQQPVKVIETWPPTCPEEHPMYVISLSCYTSFGKSYQAAEALAREEAADALESLYESTYKTYRTGGNEAKDERVAKLERFVEGRRRQRTAAVKRQREQRSRHYKSRVRYETEEAKRKYGSSLTSFEAERIGRKAAREYIDRKYGP